MSCFFDSYSFFFYFSYVLTLFSVPESVRWVGCETSRSGIYLWLKIGVIKETDRVCMASSSATRLNISFLSAEKPMSIGIAHELLWLPLSH